MNAINYQINTLCRGLALAALVGFTGINHAHAHAFIDHTDPLVGSTIKQAPAQVRLWYTQGLEPTFSRVQVFDAAGKEIDKRDIHLDPKNNHLLIVSLPTGLGAGTYKVAWRVVSVDTHVTEGTFKFQVQS